MDDVVARIFRVESDHDFLEFAGGENQAAVVGGDGHQAAAAIDENGELDLGGAAVIEKFIERSLDGAAGEEDIVDENDVGTVDIDGDLGGGEFLGNRVAADVVAVKRNIDHARGDRRGWLSRRELGREAAREFNATIRDAQKQKFLPLRVTGGNGIPEPRNRGVYLLRANGLGCGHETRLRRVGRKVGRLFLSRSPIRATALLREQP